MPVASQTHAPFFGESLLDRLRDLVSRYPKGLGLVKEFLQNADDAGATRLVITLDRRQHPGTLSDAPMNVALGPALLIANDEPFTAEDLLHVRTLGDSAKLRDAARTGRFGQGLSTWFSVSDHPSLLTGDTVLWFDPHRTILGGQNNGYEWPITEVRERWLSWLATFEPAGFSRHFDTHHGAIFRLPLRTQSDAPQSRIKKEAFSDADWEEIVTQARSFGPALLVFLRSVVTLEMREITPENRTIVRLRLTTENLADVRTARHPLRQGVRGTPSELVRAWLERSDALPSASFTHVFNIDADGAPAERMTWEVVSELVRGPSDVLLRQALELASHDEKALPWAGAAWSGDVVADCQGGFSCFLPLPEAPRAPVWLHGWFAVDSARRGIAHVQEADAQVRRRVEWNQSLMQHAVGPAWAKLIERLRGDAAMNTAPYQCWPTASFEPAEVFRTLYRGFFEAVGGLPIFRVYDDAYKWARLGDALVDVPSAWREHLDGPLRSLGYVVASPSLPEPVRELLAEVGTPITHMTPSLARQVLACAIPAAYREGPLSDPPTPALANRRWVISLAEFCASDDVKHLSGLPLALLLGERIRRFLPADPVYVCDGDSSQSLLAPLPRRRLDPELQRVVLRDQPEPAIGVLPLDARGLASIASEVHAASEDDASWLTAFFVRLEALPPQDVTTHRAVLCATPLIPSSRAGREVMGMYPRTPLLAGDSAGELVSSLRALGVNVMDGPPDLEQAVARFARRHTGFIYFVSPYNVAVSLARIAASEGYDLGALDELSVAAPILDVLSSPEGHQAIRRFSDRLRGLPLLRTQSGKRVPASSADVFAPGDFVPPDGLAGRLEVVDTGPAARWSPLVDALQVPRLDVKEFVVKVLLPSFAQAGPERHLRLLRWLRDEYPRSAAKLDQMDRERLLRKIRATPIIPLRGGGLGAPEAVYPLDATEPDEILGTAARKPDGRWFNGQWDLWRTFFEWLALPRRPLATDLHARIVALAEATPDGVSAAREQVLRLAKHCTERWGELNAERVDGDLTFGKALRTLAWLPARHGASRDAVAAIVPEVRLYRAAELAAFRVRHLVASHYPLLDGESFEKPVEEALGLKTSASLEEVLAHFDHVRRTKPSTPKEQELVKTAFLETVEFLGRVEALGPVEGWLAARRGERLVLVQDRWLIPDRIFLEPLRVALPGATSVQLDAELAGRARRDVVRTGLTRLGVREVPTGEDWLAVLADLAARTDSGATLPENDLRIARGALKELRREDAEWLAGHIVWVPTRDGKLMRAAETFIPDDHRLNRGSPEWLPLVEDIQEISDVARRAGARSLRSELKDCLSPTSIQSIILEHQRWCREHEARILNRSFAETLQRVAYDQAIQDAAHDPVAVARAVEPARLQRLRICIAEQLSLQSRLGSAGPVVFDYLVSSFVDESGTIWIAAASPQKMVDELARAVARQSLVQDTLTVSRLLAVSPSQMHAELDTYGVARIPTMRTIAEGDTTAHDNALQAGEEERSYTPAVDDGQAPTGQVDEVGKPFPDGDTSEAAAFFGEAQRGQWTGVAQPPSLGTPGLVGRVAPDAPRDLTFGTSTPWSPSLAQSSAGAGRGLNRLRSYLHAAPASDYDTSADASGEAFHEEVRAAALKAVDEYERAEGRTPAPADALMDGFDLDSSGDGGRRWIRVLAIDGPWTPRGVGLRKPEIEASHRLGDAWWLYVVEHARDPERLSIHPIQGVWQHAAEVRLDDGWKAAVAGAKPHTRSHEPVSGITVTLDDGTTATIISVVNSGPLPDVELLFPDGTTKTMMWRPTWAER